MFPVFLWGVCVMDSSSSSCDEASSPVLIRREAKDVKVTALNDFVSVVSCPAFPENGRDKLNMTVVTNLQTSYVQEAPGKFRIITEVTYPQASSSSLHGPSDAGRKRKLRDQGIVGPNPVFSSSSSVPTSVILPPPDDHRPSGSFVSSTTSADKELDSREAPCQQSSKSVCLCTPPSSPASVVLHSPTCLCSTPPFIPPPCPSAPKRLRICGPRPPAPPPPSSPSFAPPSPSFAPPAASPSFAPPSPPQCSTEPDEDALNSPDDSVVGGPPSPPDYCRKCYREVFDFKTHICDPKDVFFFDYDLSIERLFELLWGEKAPRIEKGRELRADDVLADEIHRRKLGDALDRVRCHCGCGVSRLDCLGMKAASLDDEVKLFERVDDDLRLPPPALPIERTTSPSLISEASSSFLSGKVFHRSIPIEKWIMGNEKFFSSKDLSNIMRDQPKTGKWSCHDCLIQFDSAGFPLCITCSQQCYRLCSNCFHKRACKWASETIGDVSGDICFSLPFMFCSRRHPVPYYALRLLMNHNLTLADLVLKTAKNFMKQIEKK